jgi:hypothetical protein
VETIGQSGHPEARSFLVINSKSSYFVCSEKIDWLTVDFIWPDLQRFNLPRQGILKGEVSLYN